MAQWPFRTVGINASSPTAPAKVACARNESELESGPHIWSGNMNP
jgi:hypothetical protein